MKELQEYIDSTDPQNVTPDQTEQLKAKKESLLNAANQLFAKMYEQAQAANQGGSQNFGGGSYTEPNYGTEKPGDDVVDGDYREV